ncbi:MAG: MarR family transcriptional regulator [Nesterenkonia sp.]|uniref:MarR family winged helix-turn-helix transcriptional regulator n=1 Tax=Nesterenkonia marinintestina TaxID=2979865 RepID=UPI0021C2472D|nr:MarR family transcriptional regulator [Nesterenkonia sp. GX14115]MDO5493954.1 MarR family transcriptional regulator [Nesterenkonia sp.]
MGDGRRDTVSALEREFNRLFIRRRFNALQLTRLIDPEIEPSSYSLLATLQQEGPMRMTSLSRHLGIGKPTLSRQLSTLTARGWVSKTADPDDGRAQRLDLSTEGRRRLEEAQADRTERYLAMLESWDDADVTELYGLISRLNRTYTEFDAAQAEAARQTRSVSAAPAAGA